jgi:hypothetical protein
MSEDEMLETSQAVSSEAKASKAANRIAVTDLSAISSNP